MRGDGTREPDADVLAAIAAENNDNVPHRGNAMTRRPCQGSMGCEARKMRVCAGIDTRTTPTVQAILGQTR